MEPIQYDRAPLRGGEGIVQISFTVDADPLGEGNWIVEPIFGDTMGIDTAWNGPVTPQGIQLKYCARCGSQP